MEQPIEQGRVGEGEEERREREGVVVFDPGIHLAFMVWRRLSSPLNFVFRWREPKRWEGDCGAGVRSPLIWEAHVLGQEGGGWLYRVQGYQKMPPHGNRSIYSV